MEENFFATTDHTQSIDKGEQLSIPLPRMLPADQIIRAFLDAEMTITSMAQTIFATNLIFTLLLSMSLKQMWNLLNTFQVIIYVFLFVQWPALLMVCRDYVDEVITLKDMTSIILDSGKSDFELA